VTAEQEGGPSDNDRGETDADVLPGTTAEDNREGMTTGFKVDEDEAPSHEPKPSWQLLAAQYPLVIPQ
jgi:hypothetical protein